MSNARYRADIDGLRAVAVGIILLFHAGFGTWSGGFVGVDVFFVISGFLITRLIRDEVLAGVFSLKRFYLRRLRRLFPALFFTLTASFVAAYFILTPEYMQQFSGSLIASILSVSNILFYSQVSYFDLASNLKPLLHMWSLSVEEQFYIVWPTLLALLARRARVALLPVICLIGVASLVFAQLRLSNSAAVYFLAHYRAYEFVLGALMVWAVERQPRNRLLLEPLVLVGLGLIFYAAIAFNKNTAFPGVNALIPCVGAALVIYGGTARYCGKLLSNAVVVHVGLISYSLYLIHWPLIVYYQLSVPGAPVFAQKVGIIVAALLGAEFMYRYVETPFRRARPGKPQFSPGAFASVCAACALVVVLPAGDAWLKNGWNWRIPEQIRNQMDLKGDKDYGYFDPLKLVKPFSGEGKKKILFVGDSQACDLLNMIHAVKADNATEIRLIPLQGECQAVIPGPEASYEAMKPPFDTVCRGYHEQFANSTLVREAQTVVLASSWQPWGVEQLEHTVRFLKNEGVRDVVVVGRKDQGLPGQELLKLYWPAPNMDMISAKHRNGEALAVNKEIRAVKADFKYLDLMSRFCPKDDSCRTLTQDGKVIFYDRMHVSNAAAMEMGNILKESRAFDFLDPDADSGE